MGNSERDRHILELRLNGETFRDIAREYGLSVERARQIVNKQIEEGSRREKSRLVVHLRKSRRKTERNDQIHSLLRSGKTVAEIAEIIGISRGFVYKTISLLRREGILFPEIGKCCKLDVVVARRMRDAGATLRTIACRFHVAISSVRYALARYDREVKNIRKKGK